MPSLDAYIAGICARRGRYIAGRLAVYRIATLQLARDIQACFETLSEDAPHEYRQVFGEPDSSPSTAETGPLVSCRTKTVRSIFAKVYYGELAEDEVFARLRDIAGVRVICRYLTQVAYVHKKVVRVRLKGMGYKIAEDGSQDYIDTPKTSGYRSLHIPIRITVRREGVDEEVWGELQVRTELQHAWAQHEHGLIYKNGLFRTIRKGDRALASRIRRISSKAMTVLHGVDEKLDAVRGMVQLMSKAAHRRMMRS